MRVPNTHFDLLPSYCGAQGKAVRQAGLPEADVVLGRGTLEMEAGPEKATERQSIFTMVNAVLGAGVLGYPFCYKVLRPQHRAAPGAAKGTLCQGVRRC